MKVVDALRRRYNQSKTGDNRVIVVGYSAPYAMRIHEDLEMVHPNGGQAKYLEQPIAEMKDELAAMVRDCLMKRISLGDALLKVGEAILKASQELVPVDTGNLRDSGYVRLE